MTEITDWEITCYDGVKPESPKQVRLSEQDIRLLLKMLLCLDVSEEDISHGEIIDMVAGNIESMEESRRHLLEVRPDPGSKHPYMLHTPGGNPRHYTARKVRS